MRHVVISSFDSPGHPHYGGGGAAVVEMIARRLASEFRVTVFTAGRRAGPEVRDGVTYRKLPIEWAGPYAGQLLYHLLLPFLVLRVRHDLWIENFTPPFSTGFVPLFTRGPVLGLAQALTGAEMTKRYHLPFFLVERFGLRFYRNVVVYNPAHQALVRRCRPSAEVRLMPNRIEPADVGDGELGRGDHVLFLGRINVSQKGLDLLVAAYEKSGLEAPLLIAGSGVPREERRLRSLLAESGANVQWLGHVAGHRKQQLLAGSLFVAMPSRHETFGLVALEAMAYGKPVVHFDLPTLQWMEGDVAVPSFDVEALAAQLRVLAEDRTVRCRLGAAAHAAARRSSLDAVADRYLAFVHELLRSSAPRAGQDGTGR